MQNNTLTNKPTHAVDYKYLRIRSDTSVVVVAAVVVVVVVRGGGGGGGGGFVGLDFGTRKSVRRKQVPPCSFVRFFVDCSLCSL